MCGIVGTVAERDTVPILLEGLKRLEYRGYDSAGVAVLDSENVMQRVRRQGKVAALCDAIASANVKGRTGIAHTRWATHGKPSEQNAHPHLSHDTIALVHNGIIENHDMLRASLVQNGYDCTSETDTELAVHLVHKHMGQGLAFLPAVRAMVDELDGAFALGILHRDFPDRLIAVRKGSPLVVGIGIGENFIASDPLALAPVTQQFIYLEEGDMAEVTRKEVVIYNSHGDRVERPIKRTDIQHDITDRGTYRHFMQKEIFEQPSVIADTLEGRLGKDRVLERVFGEQAKEIFDRVQRVKIVACGTSYHAGLVGQYWLEGLAGVPCTVEIASEFRYRNFAVEPGTLFVTLSQSGETADTMAALALAKSLSFESSLAICNVPESSLVRESDLVFMTRAGAEIGVASTKAFTTQLVALLMLSIVLGRRHKMTPEREAEIVGMLHNLPTRVKACLDLDLQIQQLAHLFAEKEHALFLGRGIQYPIAKEGALKLKEISYIHAESYPAGELKHGPLALVDEKMPVVAVAPNDELLGKLKSNLEEVRARGGQLIVFVDEAITMEPTSGLLSLAMPSVPKEIAPIAYTIPLQLLSYHVAVLKGTDVDKPRNLAKSVTVE